MPYGRISSGPSLSTETSSSPTQRRGSTIVSKKDAIALFPRGAPTASRNEHRTGTKHDRQSCHRYARWSPAEVALAMMACQCASHSSSRAAALCSLTYGELHGLRHLQRGRSNSLESVSRLIQARGEDIGAGSTDLRRDAYRCPVAAGPAVLVVRNYYTALERRAVDGSAVTLGYVLMSVVAALLATSGLLLDSPTVVIGAMCIAPFLGPARAVCIGGLFGNWRLFFGGLAKQLVGLLVIGAGRWLRQ